MNATIDDDMTCRPEADQCTRRGPGHYESPRQQEIAGATPEQWRYGTVRHTAATHATVIDLDDGGEPVAVWQHRDNPLLLSAGTLVALHEAAQLLMVKKVLPHRISVLVLGSPDRTSVPVEWHPRETVVDALEHVAEDAPSRETMAALFERLTRA